MGGYNLIVHPSWLDIPNFSSDEDRLEKYKEAMVESLMQSNAESIILTVPVMKVSDLWLIDLDTNISQVESVWLNGTGRKHATGYIPSSRMDLIDTLSEAEKTTINGCIFGDCPNMTIMQIMYYQQFSEYFPKSLEGIEPGQGFVTDLKYTACEEDWKHWLGRLYRAPHNWNYGIASTQSLNNAILSYNERSFTYAMLNKSQVHILTTPRPMERRRYAISCFFDSRIKKKLERCLVV